MRVLTISLLTACLAAPAARAAPAQRKIDLDVQNAKVDNVLRFLADVGKINLVLDDDVQGTITLKLKRVRWKDAFEVVLRTKGLKAEKFGRNIYRVAPRERLEKEASEKLTRDAERQKVLPLKTKFIPVNYAKASEIAKQLEPLLTERGSVSVDERTNTVILKDVVNAPVFRRRR